ncbi:MAG: histidinol-phosphate transaminase [Betaproteobacteria bacterium TMED82]|nr:MAG: histidinol-phosphate transaminase [Betaproteobacteria bacterium TMED82]|tara:strand:- start:78316 stop:79446 length:1131 start_codon:yes stop_codon:yes gene_type:complete
MINKISFLPWVKSLAKYDLGKGVRSVAELSNTNEKNIIKLASNENPFGVSPKVKAFVEDFTHELNRYPDADSYLLRSGIAKNLNISSDQIFLGNGSNDVLDYIARICLSPGSSAIFSKYSFAVYSLATNACGAEAIEVPVDTDFRPNLERLADSVKANTRVIFIANPNNPTGIYVPLKEIVAFLDNVSESVLVVLDEAYFEYIEDEQIKSINLLSSYPNLFITRSFSKAYGLAGLRLGYGIGSAEVVSFLNRLRQPFNANSIAQGAALIALKDKNFLQDSIARNKLLRENLEKELSVLALEFLPSKGNFILVNFSNRVDSDSNSGIGQIVFERLLRKGIITRPVSNYGLPDWLRISIGTETEMSSLLKTLKSLFAS